MHTSLLIPTDHIKRDQPTKKTIAKRSRQSFRLTMDDDTHRELVNLQREFTSTEMIPSRTVLARLALRRLAEDARANRRDPAWIGERSQELRFLAHAGAK